VPTIYVFAYFGLYRAFLRHVSTEVTVIIGIGALISATILLSTRLILSSAIPLSAPVIYAAFLFIAIAGIRFTLRSLFRTSMVGKLQNVAIYGAGAAGAQTFQSLKAGRDYRVRLVIDDSVNIQGETLFGQRIYSFDDAKNQFKALEINTVLLAMPSASRAQRQLIIKKLVHIGINVKTIPGLSSLIDGSAEITELKNVAIEDLLGREPVAPDPDLMNAAIKGKVVLVTGAGGSIGSELCRQIIRWQPSRLIILDQSEYAIYQLKQEIAAEAERLDIPLVPVVTSMLERAFISQTLARYKVDTIYHAAAYKHVPLIEQNVMQGVKNNVFGTKTVAECAIEAGVKDFILISTDKAVNPTNFMGASKRLCELLCQSFNKTQDETRFSMVRFGNVLGSSGSVIPLFKKQIERGGPVTVTHKNITRYFMTIPEAAQLVIQAGALAKGGEVFVLDMGEPVRIIDLATKMVRLSGLAPFFRGSGDDGDIAVEVTGLRPGEKLYEELAYDDKLLATSHPRIMSADENAMGAAELEILLEKIERSITQNDEKGISRIFALIAPDVVSNDQITNSV
jgi:FlaA1/EpsC-like NDP-sugar epimerase